LGKNCRRKNRRRIEEIFGESRPWVAAAAVAAAPHIYTLNARINAARWLPAIMRVVAVQRRRRGVPDEGHYRQ
jgi:hypothetical protein